MDAEDGLGERRPARPDKAGQTEDLTAIYGQRDLPPREGRCDEVLEFKPAGPAPAFGGI